MAIRGSNADRLPHPSAPVAAIGLIETGDAIEIDIQNRPAALQAYALMATSADKGAVRDLTQIRHK